MIKIAHRINTLEQLQQLQSLEGSSNFGIELDIRYHEDDLILHHDPFNHQNTSPAKFEDLLSEYTLKGPIILNVKTEGVEKHCIELMKKFNISNWFFLDLSMPYFIKYAIVEMGKIDGFTPDNLAVRFSEYEPIEYALSFAGKAKWVWVDCFNKLPLNANIYSTLKKSGFNICLVSPELQGHDISQISIFKKQLEEQGIKVDAVCSKRLDLW